MGLSLSKYKQDRKLEALNDLDAAVAADPFASEIMVAKFNLLQELERTEEAIELYGGGWARQAAQRANSYADRILKRVASGSSLPEAVHDIPELQFLFSNMPLYGEVGAAIECLSSHASDERRDNLQKLWELWMANNEGLRKEWRQWQDNHTRGVRE